LQKKRLEKKKILEYQDRGGKHGGRKLGKQITGSGLISLLDNVQKKENGCSIKLTGRMGEKNQLQQRAERNAGE